MSKKSNVWNWALVRNIATNISNCWQGFYSHWDIFFFWVNTRCLNHSLLKFFVSIFLLDKKFEHLRSMSVTSILQNSALRIENFVLPYQLLRCCRPLFRLMQVAPPSDWFSKCACFMNVPHLCVITHRNVVTCSTRDVLNCAKQSYLPVWVYLFFKKKWLEVSC